MSVPPCFLTAALFRYVRSCGKWTVERRLGDFFEKSVFKPSEMRPKGVKNEENVRKCAIKLKLSRFFQKNY